MDVNNAGFKWSQNKLCKCLMMNEMQSKHVLGLEDTQCVLVSNSECKQNNKTPQGVIFLSSSLIIPRVSRYNSFFFKAKQLGLNKGKWCSENQLLFNQSIHLPAQQPVDPSDRQVRHTFIHRRMISRPFVLSSQSKASLTDKCIYPTTDHPPGHLEHQPPPDQGGLTDSELTRGLQINKKSSNLWSLFLCVRVCLCDPRVWYHLTDSQWS